MGESRVGVKVVRVDEPKAFGTPIVQQLFGRAFTGEDGRSVGDVLSWVEQFIEHPDVALYVAVGEDRLSGFALLGETKHDPLSPYGWILHFHSEDGASRKALADATIGWMRDRGLQTIRVVNQTGHSDAAHMRLFRQHAEGRVVASILEYDIGEA